MNHDLNDTPMDGREGCIFLFGIFFLGLDGGSRRFPSLTRTGMDSGGVAGDGGVVNLFLSFFWFRRARKVAHFNRRLGIYGQVLVPATAGTLSRFFQQRPWCRGGVGRPV